MDRGAGTAPALIDSGEMAWTSAELIAIGPSPRSVVWIERLRSGACSRGREMMRKCVHRTHTHAHTQKYKSTDMFTYIYMDVDR